MLPMRPLPTVLLRLRSLWLVGMCCLLAACASVRYTPLATIDRVQPEVGYRLRTAVQSQTADRARADDLFVVMMFSGGGSRAARRATSSAYSARRSAPSRAEIRLKSLF